VTDVTGKQHRWSLQVQFFGQTHDLAGALWKAILYDDGDRVVSAAVCFPICGEEASEAEPIEALPRQRVMGVSRNFWLWRNRARPKTPQRRLLALPPFASIFLPIRLETGQQDKFAEMLATL